jgi:predicted transcriptional regulator
MAEPTPKPPPEDTEAFRKAVEEGLDSLNKGRSVPYEAVRRWLLSWGTDKESSPPKWR